MLPVDEENMLLGETETEEEQITSLTYRLDEERGVIAEKIDGLEAIKQSLKFALQTEREELEIYSDDYGTELSLLIGQPAPLVYINIEEAIREVLLQDDRVEDVGSFEFGQITKDSVSVKFLVTTIQGEIDMETEVNVSG